MVNSPFGTAYTWKNPQAAAWHPVKGPPPGAAAGGVLVKSPYLVYVFSMILYDPSFTLRLIDYGIMIPVSPSRPDRIIEFLNSGITAGTRGATLPYPGPVFDFTAARLRLGAAGPLINRDDLERVHSKAFTASLYDGSSLAEALLETYELMDDQGRPRRYEPEKAVKPLIDLFNTILAHVEGTYLACRLALLEGPGFCYYLEGGTHHARYDRGSGFCLLNDVASAAVKVLGETPHPAPSGREKPVRLIWVVDLDAHKGDGTAELVRFARERGELAGPGGAESAGAGCILTLSIHMAKGWPLDGESLAAARPGRAPLVPSDIDIGIDSGEEAEYLPRLEEGIGRLEGLSAEYGGRPDLILVVDGSDPYEYDGLASSAPLKLTLDQCVRRDMFVYRYAAERGIPSAWVLAGGYGERAWEPPAHFLKGIR
ncbi:MAG: hypothetical protein LBQ44_02685 [Treponema sp.]|jgi:acetoin utilization deacetylase AcuC-like enzyme|nr:hypothetical protein [Treponema sp.]